jgi:hypothetical protein
VDCTPEQLHAHLVHPKQPPVHADQFNVNDN